MELSEGAGDSPGVGILVFVVEGLDLLLLLLLAEFGRVGELEELRSKLHQPFRVHGGHFSHVFLGSQHKFMVDNPGYRKQSNYTYPLHNI